MSKFLRPTRSPLESHRERKQKEEGARKLNLSTTIQVPFQGNGAVIAVASAAAVICDFPATIYEATILGYPEGSATVRISKCQYADYPSGAAAIDGGVGLTLTSSEKNKDTALSGWDTQIKENDVLLFVVSSIALIYFLTVGLRVRK